MENFLSLSQRFSNYLKYKGLGINKTANIVGMSGSQISNIASGKVFGTDKMFIILNIFKDLDANFLFRGTGQMIIDSPDHPAEHDISLHPIGESLITTQQELLKYKDEEIQRLKKEISELKKEYKQGNTHLRVAESDPKLK